MRSRALMFAAASALAGIAACRDAGEPQNTFTMPGLDTASLTTRERSEWNSYVTELIAPCADVAVPVSQCIQEKRACAKCVPAAKFIFKRVHEGETREQIETAYKARFDPAYVKTIAVDGSPSRGAESAPIVIVEFADFECPHCGLLAPVLDALVAAHPADVRLVYKFYPLTTVHPNAEGSARAAIAAGAQGKFWEMHDVLFKNQEHLDEPSIEGYAQELGLDVKKLVADMRAAETTDRLARDMQEVTALNVDHTPTLYINGRYAELPNDLEEWVRVELGVAK